MVEKQAREMCITEKQADKVVEHKVALLKSELMIEFSELRGELKSINGGITLINEQFIKLNGSVFAHGQAISSLEEKGRHKRDSCPFKDDISLLLKVDSSNKTIQEYLTQYTMEQNRIEEKKFRWLKIVIGVFGVMLTIATILLNVL